MTVSWGVIVVNWLTIGSAEAENNLTTLMSQRNDLSGSKPEPQSRFDIGITTYNEETNQQELQMRTRHASATTAEVPVFFKAASLKDEGGLLDSDGVRESWITETGLVREVQEVPQLTEPERTWGMPSSGWAESSKSWITVDDVAVKGVSCDENLGPFRHHRMDV